MTRFNAISMYHSTLSFKCYSNTSIRSNMFIQQINRTYGSIYTHSGRIFGRTPHVVERKALFLVRFVVDQFDISTAIEFYAHIFFACSGRTCSESRTNRCLISTSIWKHSEWSLIQLSGIPQCMTGCFVSPHPEFIFNAFHIAIHDVCDL